jgi:glycine/D-amino acid oxidase-like deaminating enzyme
MGASIAFHLAKRKAGKIVVVDKGHVGQGGSERSSALIRMHYSYPPEVQLAVVSLSMFEHWLMRLAAKATSAGLALSVLFIPVRVSG